MQDLQKIFIVSEDSDGKYSYYINNSIVLVVDKDIDIDKIPFELLLMLTSPMIVFPTVVRITKDEITIIISVDQNELILKLNNQMGVKYFKILSKIKESRYDSIDFLVFQYCVNDVLKYFGGQFKFINRILQLLLGVEHEFVVEYNMCNLKIKFSSDLCTIIYDNDNINETGFCPEKENLIEICYKIADILSEYHLY